MTDEHEHEFRTWVYDALDIPVEQRREIDRLIAHVETLDRARDDDRRIYLDHLSTLSAAIAATINADNERDNVD